MAQNFVMLALGAYRFSLDTAAYQTFSRETQYNWPEQERTGLGPLLQHTGPGTDSITLQGVILPEFKGGVGQINQLRTQAGLGLPLPLISGRGNYFGLFVVGSIHEGQTVFWPDGTPRRVEFSVTIKKYNEIGLKIGNFNVSASGLLGALL